MHEYVKSNWFDSPFDMLVINWDDSKMFYYVLINIPKHLRPNQFNLIYVITNLNINLFIILIVDNMYKKIQNPLIMNLYS